MAEVFRAKTYGPAGFVKECAIKRILTTLLDDEQFVQMFVDEARVTSFLTHANIVQVLELSELEGQLYIAMEFVAGKDLLDLLARSARRGIRMPREVVLYIAIEMLKGLDFAHNATDASGAPIHIVHRDVSPSNILLSYDGQVKIGDFGIAKSGLQQSHTEIGTQKGKTGYMSPEQVTGEPFDHRSDIFAATTILFEMLTMSRLFKAANDLDIMLKIRDANIEADFERTRELPPPLVEVLRRGLAKEQEDRFASAGEMRHALEDICSAYDLRPSAEALGAFMRDLFHDRYESEIATRAADPDSLEGFASFAAANPNAARFRYRDGEGMIHGPMSAAMLEELVGSRKPVEAERVSVDGGAWKRVGEVAECARVARPGVAMLPHARPRTSEVDEHDLRLQKGTLDWEDLSLAGINPKRSNRARATERGDVSDEKLAAGVALALASPGAVAHATTPRPIDASGIDLAGPGAPARPISAPMPTVQLREYERPAVRYSPAEAEHLRRIAADDAGPPESEGATGEVSVTRLLHRLVRAKASGRLRLEGREVLRDIYLRDGNIIAIDSNAESDRLGHLLLEAGRINELQLQAALEASESGTMQLGDALVSQRACAPHELYHALQEQLREKMTAALFADDAVWSWWNESEIPTGPFPLAIDEMDALVNAVLHRPRTAVFRAFYRSRVDWPLVRVNPALAAGEFHLSAKAMRLAQMIEPSWSVRRVIEQFADRYGWREREVYQNLYLLTEFEVFRFRDEPELRLVAGDHPR